MFDEESKSRYIGIRDEVFYQMTASGSVKMLSAVSLDAEDFELLNEHANDIWNRCRNNGGNVRDWVVMAYVVSRHVYEKYQGRDEGEEDANFVPIVCSVLDITESDYHNHLRTGLPSAFRKSGIPVDVGGPRGTLLLHSQAYNFIDELFSDSYRLYGELCEDISVDLAPHIAQLVERYWEPSSGRSASTRALYRHSHKTNDGMAVSLISTILQKIDQLSNNAEISVDLGCFEKRFNEWWESRSETQTEGSVVRYYLDLNPNGFHDFRMEVTDRDLPAAPYGYRVESYAGETICEKNLPPRQKVKGKYVAKYSVPGLSVRSFDFLSGFRLINSYGKVLLDVPPVEFMAFRYNPGGECRRTSSFSSNTYLIYMKSELWTDLASEGDFTMLPDGKKSVLVTLEGGVPFRIGSTEVSVSEYRGRADIQLQGEHIKGAPVTCEGSKHIYSHHPKIQFPENIPNAIISVAGRRWEWEQVKGQASVFELPEDLGSGRFHLRISFRNREGQTYLRSFSLEYYVFENLEFIPDTMFAVERGGEIGVDDGTTLHYSAGQPYVAYTRQACGINYPLQVRTPVVLYRNDPSDRASVFEADFTSFRPKSYLLEIMPGCATDGMKVGLEFYNESVMFDELYTVVENGIAQFDIGDVYRYYSDGHVQSLCYADMYVDNCQCRLKKWDSIGQYDIKKCNGIISVTARSLPGGCRAVFRAMGHGWFREEFLRLGVPVLFHMSDLEGLYLEELGSSFKPFVYGKSPKRNLNAPEPECTIENAKMLETGDGLEQDLKKAMEMFEEIAESDDPGAREACLHLARIYMSGKRGKECRVKAAEWLHRYAKGTEHTTDGAGVQE